VWPLERRSPTILRIGRERVEWWEAATGERRAFAGIDRPLDASALDAAITQLLQAQPPVPRRLQVVVESAWSPVLALPTGPWRWNLAAQLTSLLRHRLEALYADAADPVASWTLRVDYRPGDASAIGHGLPATVRAAIERAIRASGSHLASLQPAVAWGRAACGNARPRHGWWLWLEQDRTIVAHLDGGQVTALQPAAPPLVDGVDAQHLLRTEAMRFGIEETETAVICGWQARAMVPAGMTWTPALRSRPSGITVKPAEVAP
jgi:hypothetical protein